MPEAPHRQLGILLLWTILTHRHTAQQCSHPVTGCNSLSLVSCPAQPLCLPESFQSMQVTQFSKDRGGWGTQGFPILGSHHKGAYWLKEELEEQLGQAV